MRTNPDTAVTGKSSGIPEQRDVFSVKYVNSYRISVPGVEHQQVQRYAKAEGCVQRKVYSYRISVSGVVNRQVQRYA